MAVHASRISLKQHGDTIIGERTDVKYDEKTNLLTENRTTVAEVPIEGVGTAVVRYTTTETTALPQGGNNHGRDQRKPRNLCKIQAQLDKGSWVLSEILSLFEPTTLSFIQVSRFPHSNERRPLIERRPQARPRQRWKPKPMPSACVVFPLCGCIVCLAGVAIAVSTALSGILHCELHYVYIHALMSFILASLALWMACLCCTCSMQPDLERNLPFYMIGCCCVFVVFVLFTAAVTVDGLYIYRDSSKKVVVNGSNLSLAVSVSVNDTCKYMSVQSFGVSITSYVLAVVFLVFFCVASIECMCSMCSKWFLK